MAVVLFDSIKFICLKFYRGLFTERSCYLYELAFVKKTSPSSLTLCLSLSISLSSPSLYVSSLFPFSLSLLSFPSLSVSITHLFSWLLNIRVFESTIPSYYGFIPPNLPVLLYQPTHTCQSFPSIFFLPLPSFDPSCFQFLPL